MDNLQVIFEELGLSQYLDVFVAEGFDSWLVVLDITESDLVTLNVRLGHRRKLQRAIAEFRGLPKEQTLPNSTTFAGPSQSAEDYIKEEPESPTRPKSGKRGPDPDLQSVGTGKRKYKRHPKPDENAPKRPPSAYVLFSNDVRKDLLAGEHTFTEIAKMVGERWQVLDLETKENYEEMAAKSKTRYNDEMVEYMKNTEYKNYQVYLKKWHAKQAEIQAEKDRRTVRPKTDNTIADKQTHRKGSRSWQDDYHRSRERIHSSPSRQEVALKSTSPTNTSFSPIGSPTVVNRGEREDRYSPASETTSTSSGSVLHRTEATAPSQEMLRISTLTTGKADHVAQESAKGSNTGVGLRLSQPAIKSAPSYGHGQNQSQDLDQASTQQGSSTSQGPTAMRLVHRGAASHLSSRRNSRNASSSSSSLPPLLSHEDTTLSSDGGSTPGLCVPYPHPNLPMFENDQKRTYSSTLPVTLPVLTSLLPSSFSARTDDVNVPTSSQGYPPTRQGTVLPSLKGETHQDNKASGARDGSSMAALVIAGEMARGADADMMSELQNKNDGSG